jgi:tetratricopeptide (TPR) repeat protein
MPKNQHAEDGERLQLLLEQYKRLQLGEAHGFIDEEGFAGIVDYFLEKNMNAEALEVAEHAVSIFPFSAELLILKSDILLMLKRYEDALANLDRAELFDRHNADILLIRADALLALDQEDEAERLFQQAQNDFEGEELIDLLFELADIYDDYECFQKVFDCMKSVLLLDPKNEEALYKICFWTDFTGRNQESIELHKSIIDEDPYAELAWFNLGAAYQGIKLYEKSIDAYAYAVAINEKFDYAYRNMGDAYIRLKQYKSAIECLEKVLTLSVPEDVIYEAIGYCYDKLEQYPQARQHYRKASHLDPENAGMYYKIAITYMNEGEWLHAIKSLQSALKFQLLNTDYNLAIGRCYMHLEQYEEAITYLGNVLRVRPKNKGGWMEMLNCLLRSGMYEEGVTYADLALEMTDNKPVFIYYKAAFLFSLGKSKEALTHLEQAVAALPKFVKDFLEMMPHLLKHPQVVDLISRYKKQKGSIK